MQEDAKDTMWRRHGRQTNRVPDGGPKKGDVPVRGSASRPDAEVVELALKE